MHDIYVLGSMLLQSFVIFVSFAIYEFFSEGFKSRPVEITAEILPRLHENVAALFRSKSISVYRDEVPENLSFKKLAWLQVGWPHPSLFVDFAPEAYDSDLRSFILAHEASHYLGNEPLLAIIIRSTIVVACAESGLYLVQRLPFWLGLAILILAVVSLVVFVGLPIIKIVRDQLEVKADKFAATLVGNAAAIQALELAKVLPLSTDRRLQDIRRRDLDSRIRALQKRGCAP